MEATSLDTPRGRFGALVGAASRAAAPTLLLLHGFPDTPASFVPLSRRLGAAGFRCVAPFLRGYAPSPLEGDFTLEGLVEDVRALAAAIGPVHAVVGHDWGAVVTWALLGEGGLPGLARAVTMAVPHPLEFLRDTLASPAQLYRSRYMAFFQLPIADRVVDVDFVERWWRRWSPGFDPGWQYWQQWRATMVASLPAPLAYYRGMVRPVGPALARVRRRARIDVPVLHLHGGGDGCIAPTVGRHQARHCRSLDAEVLPGVGHFLHLEDPGAVAARIAAFVRA